MAIALTLSQITEIAGANLTRMRHLAKERAILPIEEDRAEKVARRFSISEAAIACILARLDKFGTPAPTLARIGASLREIYSVQTDHDFKNADDARQLIGENMYSIFESPEWNQETKYKAMRSLNLKELPNKIKSLTTPDELHRMRAYVAMEDARLGKKTKISFYVEENQWSYWIEGVHTEPSSDEYDTGIVMNLHRVLSGLRA